MTMLLTIRHTTTYHYDEPVPYGLTQLRMTPRDSAGQTVTRWDIDVAGGHPHVSFIDHHGNVVELVGTDEHSNEVAISVDGEVETVDTHGVLSDHGGLAPLWLYERPTDLTRAGSGVQRLTRGLRASEQPLAALHDLVGRIGGAVSYRTGFTDAATPAEDAVSAGVGVCQDHAHILLAAARHLGFPARYVSGYLLMDGRVDQEAGHAWGEAWVRDLGWVAFDVSNGISPDDRYVRVATGLDYRDVAPVRGVRQGAGTEEMSVTLQVQQ